MRVRPTRLAMLAVGVLLAVGCAREPVWMLHNASGRDLILLNRQRTVRIFRGDVVMLQPMHDEVFQITDSESGWIYTAQAIPQEYLRRSWLPWTPPEAWLAVVGNGSIYLVEPETGVAEAQDQPPGFPLQPLDRGGHLPPINLTDDLDAMR